MWCFVVEQDIEQKVCPAARCMYQGKDRSCRYKELTPNDGEPPPVGDIAQAKGLTEEEVLAKASKAQRWIKVALAIDQYLETLDKPKRENEEEVANSSKVLRLFGLTKSALPLVLDRSKYEAWRRKAHVEVPYEDVDQLLRKE